MSKIELNTLIPFGKVSQILNLNINASIVLHGMVYVSINNICVRSMTDDHGLNTKDGATAVAVSTNKGGVGKTTLAAHIGAGLADSGHNVVVVDGDPQGNLSMQFTVSDESLIELQNSNIVDEYKPGDSVESYIAPGEDSDVVVTGKPSVYQATYGISFDDNLSIRMATSDQSEYKNYAKRLGFEPGDITQAVVGTESGVDILPSNHQMKNIGTELSSSRDGPFRMRSIARKLSASGYDFIIIDAPATTGILKDNVHIAATNVIIPMQAEKSSVEATRQHVEEMQKLRRDDGYSIDMTVLATVLNEVRYDGEAEKVSHVVRKLLPPHSDAIPEDMLPEDFDVDAIGNEFWSIGSDKDTTSVDVESGVIPDGLEYFWPTVGVSPIVTQEHDYTSTIVPFDIRTRVAIRRASTSNRTLYTHDEECDQLERFDVLAGLVVNLKQQQGEIGDDEDMGLTVPAAHWVANIYPSSCEYDVRLDDTDGHDPYLMPFRYPSNSPYYGGEKSASDTTHDRMVEMEESV